MLEVSHETQVEVIENVVEADVDVAGHVAYPDFAVDIAGEQVNTQFSPGFLGHHGYCREQ